MLWAARAKRLVDFQLISGSSAGIQTIDSTQALFLPIGASVSLLVMFFFFDSVQVVFTICTAGERTGHASAISRQRRGSSLSRRAAFQVSLLCFLPLLSSCDHCVCIPPVANVPVPDQTLLPAEQVRQRSSVVCLFEMVIKLLRAAALPVI